MISHNAALISALTLALAPEIQPSRLGRVSTLVSSALGDGTGNSVATSTSTDRYTRVRSAVAEFGRHEVLSESGAHGNGGGRTPPNELVYGELSLPVLATILDAVGVQEGDVFLDIGSGDGALVLGASLLYAQSNCRDCKNVIKKAVGVEIVPGLVDRSTRHAQTLDGLLDEMATASSEAADGVITELRNHQSEVEFLLGDIHSAGSDERMSSLLADTTLAVCFATTWSAGNAKKDHAEESKQTKGTATQRSPTSGTSLQGRKLPKLSRALSKLGQGARVVIIDGRLNESDGFDWQGDLRITCPDTAPYSVASLYHKR